MLTKGDKLFDREGRVWEVSSNLHYKPLVRIEPASAHHMSTAEADVYDGQGRMATFLSEEDAKAFVASLECLKAFTQYVAEPEENTSELYRLHTMAQKIVRRFENRLSGGCV